ncbi:MAG TPA: T9SS type A sorting domain-containing protein [Saprospiraceae bacterium]|nr:T9SS type A sorting domain-containing protein [Saprospiraceae bacterium]
MKNQFYFLLQFLFFGASLSAQTLLREVTAAAGGTFSNSSLILDWTLGEPVVESYSGALFLQQGFQQNFDRITAVFEPPFPDFQCEAFPNPTVEFLTIRTTHPRALEINLYDLLSQNILKTRFEKTAVIDLGQLPAGIYLLSITEGGTRFRTFKIQKAGR